MPHTVNLESEILVGCHRRNGGKCEKKNTKDAKWLVREPVCPRSRVVANMRKQQVSVLVGEGFKLCSGLVNLLCRSPVARSATDGRTNYDSTQCGGPHACNVRTVSS